MAENSKIEWTDATWNPIVGCSIVSPGCTNCYAMRMAARLQGMGVPQYASLTRGSKAGVVWTGEVALAPDHIMQAPLGWKKPKRIFVNSMGDLFHESIPDEWIDRVFAVMALCPQHVFQVLTKRAERMQKYCSGKPLNHWMNAATSLGRAAAIVGREGNPLPNVWLGVSAERQQEANERIPLLLQIPAAVRFISAEPLLGPIELWGEDKNEGALRGCGVIRSGGVTVGTPHNPPEGYDDSYPGLDWVIVGGESGPFARPMAKVWAESLRDQCQAAEVPFFMKQMARKAPIPPDLLRREFPR